MVARLMRSAEQVRELRFETEVQVSIEDRDTITAHMLEEAEEPDLERAVVTYTALGLLPEGTNVRDLLARVLGEQVVGYYDTHQKRFAIRDDVMEGLARGGNGADNAGLVLVHELVHALQDQRLGLGSTIDIERDSDPGNAFRSLVEGDATLAMFGYLTGPNGGRLSMVTQNPDGLRAMLENSPTSLGGSELENAPAILRIPLVSAYIDGLVFAATLHRDGGFAEIDRAFTQRPPVTSEQILHPDAYFRNELADAVTIPPLPTFEAAGLETIHEDTLGELEMAIYLGQTDPTGIDREAGHGWGGDRLRVFRDRAGRGGVVWFTSWDTIADAEEAELIALRLRDREAPDRRATFLVERKDRALLIVRGVDATLHGDARTAFFAFAQGLPAAAPRARP